jgi:hypothetical protein
MVGHAQWAKNTITGLRPLRPLHNRQWTEAGCSQGLTRAHATSRGILLSSNFPCPLIVCEFSDKFQTSDFEDSPARSVDCDVTNKAVISRPTVSRRWAVALLFYKVPTSGLGVQDDEASNDRPRSCHIRPPMTSPQSGIFVLIGSSLRGTD